MNDNLVSFLVIFFFATIFMVLNLALAEWFYKSKFKNNKDYSSFIFEMVGNLGIIPIIFISMVVVFVLIMGLFFALAGMNIFLAAILFYYLTTLLILLGKTYKSAKKHRYEN